MIKKLRRKFVLIAMLSLFLVMLVVLGSVNAVNLYQINRKADSLLTLLTDNNGKFPDLLPSGEPEPPHKRPGGGLDLSPETRFETRYFVVKTDAAGGISQIDTGHIAAITADQAQTFAEKVLESGKTGGYTGVYKYRVTDTDYGRLLVFLDCRSQLQTAATFLLASCAIAAVCLLLVFLLVSVLSRRAIRPFAESFEKQKQFITDAGHEIKTPLAIISANTDVLELTGGKNEWTDSIRRQTRRLDGLVKNLLTLARMEEERPVAAFSPFPLSDTAREAAEPFRPLGGIQRDPLRAGHPARPLSQRGRNGHPGIGHHFGGQRGQVCGGRGLGYGSGSPPMAGGYGWRPLTAWRFSRRGT